MLNFRKYNFFYLILIISIIFIFLSFTFIFYEYRKIKNTYNDLTFIEFLKNTQEQLRNSTFKNNRIKFINRNNFIEFSDANFQDKGYILFAGYSDNFGSSVTKLYSIQKKEIIYEWQPPIDEIHKLTPDYTSEYNLKKNYRMQHPLLLDNGELIFGSGEGPISKIDACNNLIWSASRHFHHSIEYYNSDQIIVPIITNNLHNKYPILDHGFAIVDIKTGKVDSEYSVINILEKNNYIGLLYGVGEFEYDRVHLNDAEIIKKTDEYFLEGDIMLSSKHLSTVFLYRPSTNKIIWLKTGPWLNQHDVDYLGEGYFSIFGNDTFRYNKIETHDVFYSGNNNIYIYDYNNDKIEQTYSTNMKNIKTPTQGLHKILNNGDLFVEETDNFKIYRFGKNIKRWDFVNLLDNNKIGSIHWSRYLDENTNLDWLKSTNC